MNLQISEVLANVERIDELTKKKVVTREFIPVNTRGMDIIENVDIANDITAFSLEKNMRLVAVNKQLYKLTSKSWSELKKELTKRGIIWRFDNSGRGK